MSKKIFTKGAIVREVKNGVPRGPYLRVMCVNSAQIIAKAFLSSAVVELPRKRAYVPTMVSLSVSKDIIRGIKNGFQHSVSHKSTPMWNKLLDNPELVTFYTHDGFEKVVCTVGIANLIYSPTLREKTVKVSIERIIERKPIL